MSLTMTRVVNAPLDRVWRAWTNPTELKQWYAPEHMTTPVVEIDLREGGAYRVSMKGDEGEHVASGVFKKVTAPRTLVFSWRWEGSPAPETTVTVELKELSETTTEITLRHEGFGDEESRARHTEGWESTMNKLEKYLS
jgi:uncharacterized protein YndB with AHSA1/START domain